MKEPQQDNGVMQLYANGTNQIRNSYPQVFFLSLRKIGILAKSTTIWEGNPTRIMTLGGYPD
jgi:hypothetical protein